MGCMIKICGITDVKETEYLKENNVDFAGLVMFFEKSKRNITPEKAKEIIAALKNTSIKTVAVMVKPSGEQIHMAEEAGVDYLQIHGNVDEELLGKCNKPVLKAFNVDDLDKYEHYLTFEKIRGFVFDAGAPGSGKTFDWNILAELKRQEDKYYILAGGLDSSNVKEAIERVKPDGVDVSSGVEYGKEIVGKNPDKISEFVTLVRSL